MFPPSFVKRHVLEFTEPGEVVFDPFSGRGTTVFESLLHNRPAYGLDINPVAACISAAKADPPQLRNVHKRLAELRSLAGMSSVDMPSSEFFENAFEPSTLAQICFLRKALSWQTSKVDCFIAAMALGCLHGESHKTPNCFSNRMPRTISTKPDYSVRWWQKNGTVAPRRDVFDILERQATFRFARGVAPLSGETRLADVRKASRVFRKIRGRVRLVITSPPYLDTTDYGEDQWLRLWLLGGAERPKGRLFSDGRHDSVDGYWQFLAEAWAGIGDLLAPDCTIVIRIGGRAFTSSSIRAGLVASMKMGLGWDSIEEVEPLVTSEILNRQTNVFRPGTAGRREEHDFVLRAAA
jgi:hypothetical protein